MTWRRDEIALGQRFATEDSSVIYEVVAIADRPMVVLRPVRPPGMIVGGEMDLHMVIESADFGKWRKVRLESPEDREQ